MKLRLCIAVVILHAFSGVASARIINFFEFLQDLPTPLPGEVVRSPTIHWDLHLTSGLAADYVGTVVLTGPTKADFATQLAAHINGIAGYDVAVVEGDKVLLEPDIVRISLDGSTTPGYVKWGIRTESDIEGLSFFAQPSLITTSSLLLGPGHFEATGPGALSASFDLPMGSSATDVLEALRVAMETAGYMPEINGNRLFFRPTAAGEVAFITDGPGLNYGAGGIPEPSTWLLCAASLALLPALRRRS